MALFRNRSPERIMRACLMIISAAVLFTGTWSLWHSWHGTVQDAEKDAKNQSLSLSRQAQDTFLQVELTLEELARNADAMFAAPSHFAGPGGLLAMQKSKLPQLNGLFVYDAQGRWVTTTAKHVPPRANNADREYFIWHREHNDALIHVGHVIRSRSSGELIIPVSLRLNDAQGAFRGVVLGTVRVDFFRHFYGWYEQGPNDLLGLLHADGTILYMRPFPDSVINRSLAHSPLFTRLLKSALTGTRTWKNRVDGVTRLTGYARLERYPLVAVAGYDRNALQRTWFSNNAVIIILNGLLLLLVIVLGLLGLRQFNTTLRKQRELLEVRDELTRVNHTLQDLALVDGLTGIGNRRQFDFYLEQCLLRAKGSGLPVSLVMLDIDFFKNYNDAFGHVAGDECLRQVAEILDHLPRRGADRVTRYGGEEFALILPGTGADEARQVAKRALATLRRAALPHSASPLPEKIVTLSGGVSTAHPGGSADELKRAADAALYQAKRAGRNRIMGAGVVKEGE